MKIVDITGPIYTGMWSYCPEYPGAVITELPQPEFLKGRYPVYCQKFEIGGQTGTYIETKAHVDKSANPVSELPVDKFILDCAIIRLSKKEAGEKITLEEVKSRSGPLHPGEAVLLSTGWDSRWRDPLYVEGSPFISREAAEWLIDKGITLLGADLPRFDNIKQPEFPWKLLWEKVELVLAPVVNLHQVRKDKVKLIAFPLKIGGACSTPTRAVVIEDYEK